MKKALAYLPLFVFGFFLFTFFTSQSLAATLSLSAPASSYNVNDTFAVTVGLTALASEQVAGVDVPALTFDATKLQVQGTQITVISSALGPAIKASTTVNSINNSTGIVTFGMQYWANIANNPPFANGTVAIATINFRATGTGSATISTGSQALVASYYGTNVLTGSPATLALTLNPGADTTAPAVSVSAPTAGATVSGPQIILSATASDNVAVAGVQFRVDGVNVGPEDTTLPSPFSASWNTIGLADNSPHVITAVARDAAGNTTTSLGVTVYVNNSTSNKFVIGDRVQVGTGGVNARIGAGPTFSPSVGTPNPQPVGALGTVLSGPSVGGGYTWWNINYDSGADGWSNETPLSKYTPPFDFYLTSAGNSVVTVGSSVPNVINVNPLSSLVQSVGTFSASGLPSGASASFSPLSCTPAPYPASCQVTMTINSGSATPVANTTVTVSAISGSLTRSTTFNLTINAQSDTQAPTAPGNVIVTAPAYDQINLSWTASTDDIAVTGYSIYQNDVVLQTTTGTTYQVTGRSGNTTYRFFIEAYDASGKATRSPEQTITTPAPPDQTAPNLNITAPIAGATVSGAQTIFSADASDNVGGSGMASVQFLIDGTSLGATDTVSPYRTSWDSTTVPSGSTHTLTVVATDISQNQTTGSVSFSVSNIISDTTAPVISNIVVTPQQNSATLTFTTNEPAMAFVGYGLTTAYGSFWGDYFQLHTNHQAVLSWDTVLTSPLVPGRTYNYYILVGDQVGNNIQTQNGTFQTLPSAVIDVTPPPAITNLRVTDTKDRSVTLAWTSPTDTGGSSSRVQTYDLNYANFDLTASNWANGRLAPGVSAPGASGTAETYTLIDLTPGTTYSIAIKSTDASGIVSPISNVVTVATFAATSNNNGGGGGGGDYTPPGKANNIKIKEFDSQISLSWTNPTDSDFLRTVVVKKQGSAPGSIQDGTVVYQGKLADYTDTAVQSNNVYYYSFYTVDNSSNYSLASVISGTLKAGVTQAVGNGGLSNNTVASGGLVSVSGPFSVGMRSNEVKILQQILAQDPTIYPEGKITGFYGPATVAAVKRFQAQYMGITSGTPSTNGYGLAGKTTRNKINEIFALGGAGQLGNSGNASGATNNSSGTTGSTNATVGQMVVGPFSIGMRSGQVKILQQILAQDPTIYPEGKITGFYGPATVKAVKRFQSKYMGITSGTPSTNGYGLAGPGTRARINQVFGGAGVTGQTSILTPEEKALLIEKLEKQIAELVVIINDLIQAQKATP